MRRVTMIAFMLPQATVQPIEVRFKAQNTGMHAWMMTIRTRADKDYEPYSFGVLRSHSFPHKESKRPQFSPGEVRAFLSGGRAENPLGSGECLLLLEIVSQERNARGARRKEF